jgi:NDP-sugar pyrophosphorylase family protein
VKNLSPWLEEGSLLIHNADIFAGLPLTSLVEAHRASGLPVTMALRSSGPGLHVAVNDDASRVTDIREYLDRAPGTHQFTGIYCADRELLDLIPGGQKVSVIPAFLELAKAGRLGCVVLDEGAWVDLGDPATLLAAHLDPDHDPGVPRIHVGARIEAGAEVDGASWVGAGAEVPAGTVLSRCLVLPGAKVAPGLHDRAVCFGDGGLVH